MVMLNLYKVKLVTNSRRVRQSSADRYGNVKGGPFVLFYAEEIPPDKSSSVQLPSANSRTRESWESLRLTCGRCPADRAGAAAPRADGQAPSPRSSKSPPTPVPVPASAVDGRVLPRANSRPTSFPPLPPPTLLPTLLSTPTSFRSPFRRRCGPRSLPPKKHSSRPSPSTSTSLSHPPRPLATTSLSPHSLQVRVQVRAQRPASETPAAAASTTSTAEVSACMCGCCAHADGGNAGGSVVGRKAGGERGLAGV